MAKRFIAFIAVLIVLPVAFFGCKGKVEKTDDLASMETTAVTPLQEEALSTQPVEPSQMVAMEPIPPTASPQVSAKSALPSDKSARNKDIQLALSKAGLYQGAIDGKIGPKTKRAIEAFQKEKGLKVDGKVGPRTWAELEKHLR